MPFRSGRSLRCRCGPTFGLLASVLPHSTFGRRTPLPAGRQVDLGRMRVFMN